MSLERECMAGIQNSTAPRRAIAIEAQDSLTPGALDGVWCYQLHSVGGSPSSARDEIGISRRGMGIFS